MKTRIQQLMKQQGMSQKEFATELCIAEGTLSSIYTGRTKPSNNIVYSIHERFPEVSIPWLMFGEGDMYASAEASTPSVGASAAPASISSDLFQGFVPQLSTTPQQPEVARPVEKPQRRITEIRVFFDDGTFQTFNAE